MKRWHIAIVSLLLVAVAAAVCLTRLTPPKAGDLPKTLGVNLSNVDRVVLRSGVYGTSRVITGKADINAFFSRFNGSKLTKEADLGPFTGYTFDAQLYQDGQAAGSFIFSGSEVIVPAGGNSSIEYRSSKAVNNDRISREYGLRP